MASIATTQHEIEIEDLQAQLDTILEPYANAPRPGKRNHLSAILTAMRFLRLGPSITPDNRTKLVAMALTRFANDVVGKRCPLLEARIRICPAASTQYRFWLTGTRVTQGDDEHLIG